MRVLQGRDIFFFVFYFVYFFFLMNRRPPRSTQSRSSAASDVYKRQVPVLCTGKEKDLDIERILRCAQQQTVVGQRTLCPALNERRKVEPVPAADLLHQHSGFGQGATVRGGAVAPGQSPGLTHLRREPGSFVQDGSTSDGVGTHGDSLAGSTPANGIELENGRGDARIGWNRTEIKAQEGCQALLLAYLERVDCVQVGVVSIELVERGVLRALITIHVLLICLLFR